MQLQVLSSGSAGNATLIRAGEQTVLVDAGLGPRNMAQRLESAGVSPKGLDHILITHGHLDHARSAGALAKKHDATLHCAQGYMGHPAFKRAAKLSTLPVDGEIFLESRHDEAPIRAETMGLPHDCDPTVALRLSHEDISCGILTDMGEPRLDVARRLFGVDVLVLEFNYDHDKLMEGPYPDALKRRITGGRGHLSNLQSQRMLEWIASADMHTVVLAHLSAKNNDATLATTCAIEVLHRLGYYQCNIMVAEQDDVGPNIDVGQRPAEHAGIDFIETPDPGGRVRQDLAAE